MKKLLFCFVLCSGFAYAGPFDLTLKKFNFSYKNPHGEGSAASFSRDGAADKEAKVLVDKIDDLFKIQISGSETHELEFKNAPEFILNAELMDVSNLDLGTDNNLSLVLQKGVFSSQESSLKLEGLSLVCDKVSSLEGMDQFYSGCIQSLALKSSKFRSDFIEEALTKVLAETIGVNGLDLKIKSGKYSLSAEVKASVSGKVKSSGTVAYDSQKGLLTLKVSEVKFSIFNITSKVFDELEKKETEKFVVKEPYVYITVK